MKTTQLRRLFRLPEAFLDAMIDKEFTTCWYASSGMDIRPMELLDPSHPDALFSDEKVDVFFYTDLAFSFDGGSGDFFFNNSKVDFQSSFHPLYGDRTKEGKIVFPLCQFQNSSRQIIQENFIEFNHLNHLENKYANKHFPSQVYEAHQRENWKNADEILKNAPNKERERLFTDLGYQTAYILSHGTPSFDLFVGHYEPTVVVVEHQREDGSPFFVFYIEMDDATFETLLIRKKLKIDFAAHWGGWAGPGPTRLGNLGCRYAIGRCGENLSEDSDNMAYNTIPLRNFDWRPEDDVKTLFRVQTHR